MIRGTWLSQRITPCAVNRQEERYSVGYGEIVNRHAGKLVPPTIHPKLSNIHPFQQSLAVITRALLSGFETFDLLSASITIHGRFSNYAANLSRPSLHLFLSLVKRIFNFAVFL